MTNGHGKKYFNQFLKYGEDHYNKFPKTQDDENSVIKNLIPIASKTFIHKFNACNSSIR